MKRITISISNKELNQLEDLAVCEISQEETDVYCKTLLKVWKRMVREYDREKEAASK